MVDEVQTEENPYGFPVHEVRETQSRTVRGGVIVILVKRTIQTGTPNTVAATQEDVVCLDGASAASIIGDFLTSAPAVPNA